MPVSRVPGSVAGVLDPGLDPVSLARETLQDICRSKTAPAAARAQAARTLLELAGALKNGVQNGVPAGEMSAEELDRALQEARVPVS